MSIAARVLELAWTTGVIYVLSRLFVARARIEIVTYSRKNPYPPPAAVESKRCPLPPFSFTIVRPTSGPLLASSQSFLFIISLSRVSRLQFRASINVGQPPQPPLWTFRARDAGAGAAQRAGLTSLKCPRCERAFKLTLVGRVDEG